MRVIFLSETLLKCTSGPSTQQIRGSLDATPSPLCGSYVPEHLPQRLPGLTSSPSATHPRHSANSPSLFPPHSPTLAVPSALCPLLQHQVDSCLPLSKFPLRCHPLRKASLHPQRSLSICSSEYLSLPHIMGSLSLFIYSSSVSLTGVSFTFTAVSPPPPPCREHAWHGLGSQATSVG